MQQSEYFKKLKTETSHLYDLANKARKTGIDPKDFVEVKIAENLAERVVGLISAVAPQIAGSGAIERIIELEEKYAPLDWRVALIIADEISKEKFCSFNDKKEAMEVGIRTGFAYVTLGVVSAPLEGFTSLEIKKRNDKGEYFCLNYAGPVRAAGGTAAAVSVIIADYVRVKNGYESYDPTEKEIKRCHAELEDYHEYITNLQYFPSKKETEFLMKHLPVEISGDPSERYEISSALLKDLPRIPTNVLRSGYCLIHSSCVPLKAPKLWKQLKNWGEDLDLKHWNFLGEFVELQSSMKSKGASKKEENRLPPDYTYIKDLVGGRPVLGHPLRNGAFRLRYGRSRTSGFSAQSVHPATMIILNKFLAIGTQLKVERPGKAAAYTSCDTIEGPIVKLHNGDVLKIDSVKKANQYYSQVKEILYCGDVLINYGDFFDRAHKLVPPGYCQEIWLLDLDKKKLAREFPEKAQLILADVLRFKPTFEEAKAICQKCDAPMHPDFVYYWDAISPQEVLDLREYLQSEKDSLDKRKRLLELIGLPHRVREGKVLVRKEHDEAIAEILNLNNQVKAELKEEVYDQVNFFSPYKIKPKEGTFIGSRMGRPEKAKMRKLTGSPHGIFPVGEEGGRLRSFQSALEAGKINSLFQIYTCSCGHETPLRVCEKCGKSTELKSFENKNEYTGEMKTYKFTKATINIRPLIDSMKKILQTNIIPDLIKGVRGTWSEHHTAEHLAKAILRAKYDVHVNKDGTVRYDCSELPLTHFKPKEVSVSVEKLKELGYDKDIKGNPLESPNQVLELKVQDIVLPCSPDALDEPADEVLFRVTKFVDELLEKVYKLPPHYNLESKEDLVGHLAVGLAPHTSAGIVMRIIGFSKTQGFFAHPYVHAAMRRDADGDEACILLLADAFLNFSKDYLPSSRGSTMDAPLVLTTKLIPKEVDDMVFNLDIAWNYPKELYDAANEYKLPYDVKVPLVADRLGEENQYYGFGFTHDTDDLNEGVLCSAYKTLPSMAEKVESQMDLAVKIRAVDEKDVAKLIIDKHFIRDTKGNLRKFSLQQFRCVACNEKYRRPPLAGKCVKCSGKVIFTISEGSIIKYMKYMQMLSEKYSVDQYTKLVIEMTQKRIEGVFGREKEKQTGLSEF